VPACSANGRRQYLSSDAALRAPNWTSTIRPFRPTHWSIPALTCVRLRHQVHRKRDRVSAAGRTFNGKWRPGHPCKRNRQQHLPTCCLILAPDSPALPPLIALPPTDLSSDVPIKIGRQPAVTYALAWGDKTASFICDESRELIETADRDSECILVHTLRLEKVSVTSDKAWVAFP